MQNTPSALCLQESSIGIVSRTPRAKWASPLSSFSLQPLFARLRPSAVLSKREKYIFCQLNMQEFDRFCTCSELTVLASFYCIIFAKAINCTCHKLSEDLANTSMFLRISEQLKFDIFQNIKEHHSMSLRLKQTKNKKNKKTQMLLNLSLFPLCIRWFLKLFFNSSNVDVFHDLCFWYLCFFYFQKLKYVLKEKY